MPDMVSADAPGRVNLIGEHTDYHDGFVLPTVLPQRTSVEVRQRTDKRVRAWSARLAPQIGEYLLGRESRGAGLLSYVQGVAAILGCVGAGLIGFDVRIESSFPVGGGVSASAAPEV